jgi:hypothetical protein
MFLQIESSTQFSAAFAKVELHMIVTNSLRRAGNTAAAAAGVPKYLRNGHCRWRQVQEDAQEITESRQYVEKGATPLRK